MSPFLFLWLATSETACFYEADGRVDGPFPANEALALLPSEVTGKLTDLQRKRFEKRLSRPPGRDFHWLLKWTGKKVVLEPMPLINAPGGTA